MRTIGITRFIVFLCLLLTADNCFSQPGAIDPTFNPSDQGFGYGDGANLPVNSVAIQNDGKIIIGGGFYQYNGKVRNGLARLNANGTTDLSFVPAFEDFSYIDVVRLQSDGKILVAGEFYINGNTIRLARINPDGSIDAGFTTGTGPNNSIYSVSIQTDGKIIIAGDFTSYNGTARARIARLNANGTLDGTFNPGTGADQSIRTTCIQSDGKIIIGGAFTSFNSATHNYIARLNTNGTPDAGFLSGTGATDYIFCSALQTDGKILIGGDFTSYDGDPFGRIARLNTDGSPDVTFTNVTGANQSVFSIAVQNDGKIFIGGSFANYDGTTRPGIARLNTLGSLDLSFDPGTGPYNRIYSSAIQSNGKIILAGDFLKYNGVPKGYICRANDNGSVDLTFCPQTGANSYVTTCPLQQDGKIMIGGNFTAYNGTNRNKIARLLTDGTIDATFDPGTGVTSAPFSTEVVNSISVQSDGKMIIGGEFSFYNNTARNNIARVNANGSLDNSFSPGTGTDGPIYKTFLQNDGKVIIGGFFTDYNGSTRNNIARINTDGTPDNTFVTGTGTDAEVVAINIQTDGKVLIGGFIQTYNNTPVSYFTRLNTNGSIDGGFTSAADGSVYSIALQTDGKILIGGAFNNYGAQSRGKIARLNTDGTVDMSFNPGTGFDNSITHISILPDGKIMAFGNFSDYNGNPVVGIARLNTDGSLDQTFITQADPNETILESSIQSDGKIVIAGSFISYNGFGKNRVNRLEIDCNGNTNDNATGAISLNINAGCTGFPFSNICGTQNTGEPFASCSGTAGYKTTWFKFIAPASGAVRISNDHSGGLMGADSRIVLYSATNVSDYASFVSIACDDDNGVNVPTRSILYATGLVAGTTYYIAVDGKTSGSVTGTFCITVDELDTLMLSASTNCTAGQPLSNINESYRGWLSATDASGDLIALIRNNTGSGVSSYNFSQNINNAPVRTDAISGQKYMDRNFNISNTAITNADLRFFFLGTELSSLQSVDAGVTLANLQATRQTGAVCQDDFIAANGTNTSLTQTANGAGTGFNWIQLNSPGLSNFYLHTAKTLCPVKVFLQGAYSTSLLRHKEVTTTWASVLNANALSHPYSLAPFNYTGTESVNPGFFAPTTNNTDITDWMLLEIRDATTPSIVMSRRAVFVREDGQLVDLDGVSPPVFRNLPAGSYFIALRHRNHLDIRSSAVQLLDGTLGLTANNSTYDFTDAQSKAFQNVSNTINAAQKDFGNGVFGMWGGNGNSNTTVRANGPIAINDYLFLVTITLGGDITMVQNNVYKTVDYNLDGTVRANGPLALNDYLFLFTTVLLGDVLKILNQHQ